MSDINLELLEAFEAIMSTHDEDIGMSAFPDSDSIGSESDPDGGNVRDMPLTFGMLRRARAAIAKARNLIPHRIEVTVGSLWDYDRSLDHATWRPPLKVVEIDDGFGMGKLVRFDQAMPYHGYGIEYFGSGFGFPFTPYKGQRGEDS